MKRNDFRRSDAEYWQRLRRDRCSNAAAILAAVAALFGTLGVITGLVDGPHHASRGGLLSWLLMLRSRLQRCDRPGYTSLNHALPAI